MMFDLNSHFRFVFRFCVVDAIDSAAGIHATAATWLVAGAGREILECQLGAGKTGPIIWIGPVLPAARRYNSPGLPGNATVRC